MMPWTEGLTHDLEDESHCGEKAIQAYSNVASSGVSAQMTNAAHCLIDPVRH